MNEIRPNCGKPFFIESVGISCELEKGHGGKCRSGGWSWWITTRNERILESIIGFLVPTLFIALAFIVGLYYGLGLASQKSDAMFDRAFAQMTLIQSKIEQLENTLADQELDENPWYLMKSTGMPQSMTGTMTSTDQSFR